MGLRRRILLGTLLGVLLVTLAGIFLITMTDYGRERVRLFSVGQLADRIEGYVTIERVTGNLLSGATLEEVVITDAQRRPFLRADTLSLKYSVRSLFQKHLVFSDVRVVRPIVVFDQPPGEKWNVERIFPSDTTVTPQGETVPGWGDWVRIEGLTVVDGTVTVLREWAPPEDQAEPGFSVVPNGREWVVPAPGGQQVMSIFHQVNGRFPLVRLADPDSAAHVVVIDSLATVAMPFRPPAAFVQDMEGRLTIWEDTLGFEGLEVTLPESRFVVDGFYAFGSPSGMDVRLHGKAVSLPDLRWIRPSLPEGGGRIDLAVAQGKHGTRVVARDMDLSVEGGRLEGFAALEAGEEGARLEDSDLRFTDVDTRVLERLIPEVDLPVDGVLSGAARLAGATEELDVDGWATVRERSGATSRVDADGVIVNQGGGVIAQGLVLRFDPLRMTLVEAVGADVRVGGAVTGSATLNGPLRSMFSVNADLTHVAPATGRSRVLAQGDLTVVGEPFARDLRLRFDPLRAELVSAVASGFPLDGTITGTATVSGPLRETFSVDADLVHEQAEVGRSRVLAEGGVRVEGGLLARDLRVRMDPLQMALVREFQPDLPGDGTLAGLATLDGSFDGRLTARALDVVHEGSGGRSALEGSVALTLDGGVRAFEVDVVTNPLALATVGRFVPALGLRGSVSGPVAVRGTPASATLDAQLDVAGGGTMAARGTVGLGADARYDVVASLTGLDASAVSSRGPRTALTGEVRATGVGTDPATARATVDARLVDSRLEGTPRLDSTRVTVHTLDGLSTFERGHVRLASAQADFEGTFGLVEGRSGELRYSVLLDSLSDFDALVPPGTEGVVSTRPLPHAVELAAAREDSLRLAQDRFVESVATGELAPEPPPLDTAPPLPRDSISGTLRAEGVLTGNVTRFGTQGRAELTNVVLRGHQLGSGLVEYEARDLGTDRVALAATAKLEGVRTLGFAFDSATAAVEHRGGRVVGSGHAELSVFQDAARDYRLAADYDVALDKKELVLEQVEMRFDTTRWISQQPGVVSWAGAGVELEHIELANGQGGRVFADGVLPDGVPGELRLDVDSLQIADFAALLQDTLATRGLVSLDAMVRGTLSAPLVEGTLALDSAWRSAQRLPDLDGTFAYAARELTLRGLGSADGRTLFAAEGRVPVDLALADRSGPRLLDSPLSLDIAADSLPLEVLPSFTPALEGLRGTVRGDLAVRGTTRDPEFSGQLRLTGGEARAPDAGITLLDGTGAFTLEADRVRIDSLIATSQEGELRVTGALTLATLARPELDLEVRATEAVLVDSDQARIRADVALAVDGPLDSLQVAGDVRVEDGEIFLPEPEEHRRATRLDDPTLVGVLDTLGVPPELRPGTPLLGNVASMDVRVRIERDTWVQNSDLHLEVYTPPDEPPLRVSVNPAQRSLVLDGVVYTDHGEYTFAGRQMELSSGSITFLGLDQPDPLLQLSVQHEVPRRGREALMILVNVGGYLSRPVVTLSSNQEPPLPESDLLSYLAFGRASSSLLGSEGSGVLGDALGGLGVLAEQQLAGLGLGALTDELLSTVEARGASAGLDVFRMHPGAMPDELNYSGYFGSLLQGVEVEGGEYLGRLFLSASVRPAANTLPGLAAEYRTPQGLEWITTWEPRYLPVRPSLAVTEGASSQVFGTFLMWNLRY